MKSYTNIFILVQFDRNPHQPAYIATQGPLDATVADFWQVRDTLFLCYQWPSQYSTLASHAADAWLCMCVCWRGGGVLVTFHCVYAVYYT